MKSNFYILVPRQKHFKNNTKIVKFKKDKTTYKKVVYRYRITFKNNIFIIKDITSTKELENIKQYITKMELYSKTTYYKKGYKKVMLTAS
jgi:hypothetical protein